MSETFLKCKTKLLPTTSKHKLFHYFLSAIFPKASTLYLEGEGENYFFLTAVLNLPLNDNFTLCHLCLVLDTTKQFP